MRLTLDGYQKYARLTSIYQRNKRWSSWTYPVLGLMEEAGEVSGKFAKIIRDQNGLMTESDIEEIVKELGDVLWMVSQIAAELKVPLSVVAEVNLEKLQERKRNNTIEGSGDNR